MITDKISLRQEGFKKSVENSTLGWVGVSGVGQNPQKNQKKTCL